MKIFLFTSNAADCETVIGTKDKFFKKIGKLADAAKGDEATVEANFIEVRRVLTEAFQNAVDITLPRPANAVANAAKIAGGYEIAAYATAGNRIISEEDDGSSWKAFKRYLPNVVASGTLHGTEEAKMEFLAVNFAHTGNQRYIRSAFWNNMVSTGGASLQFGLVYRPDMHEAFVDFFQAVDRAALECNIERIIFDWIDVFEMTLDGVRNMQFNSILKENHAITREHMTRLIALRRIEEPDEEVLLEMSELRIELDQINQDFLDRVAGVCAQAHQDDHGCFIGLSFLGILGAKGTCAEVKKLDAGYHVIAGVDKFKSVFEIFISEPGKPKVVIDPMATAVDEGLVRQLIEFDPLYIYLVRLIAVNGKPFLPAGNWLTGIDLYEGGSRLMLPVYVHSMNILLGINRAAVTQERKTDWTYGAAWVTGAYKTCSFGAVPVVPAVFHLEQHSIKSLETALSTFL